MKPNLLCLLGLIIVPVFSFGQEIEKNWFDKQDSVYGYYSIIKPVSSRTQGALVLLDGYGGNADSFLQETRIHGVAYSNDLLVICIPTGFRLYADASIISLLNQVLSGLRERFHLRKEQFALGGMSSGGTIALRYAEMCIENPENFPILPKALFDVDSPIDLGDLYRSAARDLKKKSGGWWLGESKMIIDTLGKALGDPDNAVDHYDRVSPFNSRNEMPGNEKYLKEVAFRTYHDVDVSWYIQNRRRSIYEMNMLNASELVNRLVLQGNSQAEFVSSKIEGRRNDGTRHPHSWNIVDEVDLVQWVKTKLHFYPNQIEKPFVYPTPPGWASEQILFPFDFAPSIPYAGFEELRFAPGWGDPNSPQKWGYTLLWWLADVYPINEMTLKENLDAYFTGLTKRRAIAEKLDMKTWQPARATIQKAKTASGDRATYEGKIAIFDSQVTKKPATLYIKIHHKDNADPTKTTLLMEVAENEFDKSIWHELDQINNDIKLSK